MTIDDESQDSEPLATGANEESEIEPGESERPQANDSDKISGSNEVNFETLLKVPVSLSIEVGRKQMRLDDLLDTQEGSVMELDKQLDEPLDILVNGALIAHGVIVLAQDRFGIQITDILSPEERARTL